MRDASPRSLRSFRPSRHQPAMRWTGTRCPRTRGLPPATPGVRTIREPRSPVERLVVVFIDRNLLRREENPRLKTLPNRRNLLARSVRVHDLANRRCVLASQHAGHDRRAASAMWLGNLKSRPVHARLCEHLGFDLPILLTEYFRSVSAPLAYSVASRIR